MAIRKNLQLGLVAIGLSLLALNLTLPATAADIVIDESGDAGGAGPDGAGGNPGATSGPAVVVGGTLTGEAGGNGDPGEPGQPGTDGIGGGPVQLSTTAPTDGSIVISTDGGAGGHGGQGGLGGDGGDSQMAFSTTLGEPVIAGKGGDGGDGGVGGTGGKGGAAGSITLTVDYAVAGDLSLSASGGDGGDGGAGGQGGIGGDGGWSISQGANSTAGDGGDGGDGAIGGSPGQPGPWSIGLGNSGTIGQDGSIGSPGQSLPALYNGADGSDGAGGTITVVLSASVGGNLTANAGTGSINVTLNTGASVGGTISANEAATSALRFAMSVNSETDYRAAKAYLGDRANALSGSLTINGQTFTWTGFDELVQALVFAGVRKSATNEASGPTYLACSPRAVTAFYKDGGIELIARRTATQGAFRIGHLTGRSFSSQNNAGWTVRFDSTGKAARFEVLDSAGTIVATCQG